jgi:hypothetical protein
MTPITDQEARLLLCPVCHDIICECVGAIEEMGAPVDAGEEDYETRL